MDTHIEEDNQMNIKVIDGTTTIINDQQIKNIDQGNKHRMRCRNRTPQGTQTIKKKWYRPTGQTQNML